MSEQSAPYGPYSDIPAKVDQLRNVQRVMIDRFDGLESRIDVRFTALVREISTIQEHQQIMAATLKDIHQTQQAMSTMLAEILARLPQQPGPNDQQ